MVEISDAVVTLAADYFQYERCEKDESECPNGRTFVTDGLAFLEDPPETPPYDLFIIDVYTGSVCIHSLGPACHRAHIKTLCDQDGILLPSSCARSCRTCAASGCALEACSS